MGLPAAGWRDGAGSRPWLTIRLRLAPSRRLCAWAALSSRIGA